MLNFNVHKKFINDFVFINHLGSSQIYEHFSQHGNTANADKLNYPSLYRHTMKVLIVGSNLLVINKMTYICMAIVRITACLNAMQNTL